MCNANPQLSHLFKFSSNRVTGLNDTYVSLFTAVNQQGDNEVEAEFQHYPNGPLLRVSCRGFRSTFDQQIHALKKDSFGWHLALTTAFCLKDCKIDIASYVDACVPHVLEEACQSERPVAMLFQVILDYQNVRDATCT